MTSENPVIEFFNKSASDKLFDSDCCIKFVLVWCFLWKKKEKNKIKSNETIC